MLYYLQGVAVVMILFGVGCLYWIIVNMIDRLK